MARLNGRLGDEIESAALIRSEMMPGRMKRATLKASTLSASIALVLPAEPGGTRLSRSLTVAADQPWARFTASVMARLANTRQRCDLYSTDP